MEETYNSVNRYYREQFGGKVCKLTLPGGTTCPHRGVSGGGCTFCRAGSGDFAAEGKTAAEQLEFAKKSISAKAHDCRFIAYFQSYTATFGPLDSLRQRALSLAALDEIVAVDIATRPDCLGKNVLSLFAEIAAKKPLFVELGLQTSDENTAHAINRGYSNSVYQSAVKTLTSAGYTVISHIILGLPGETEETMLASVRYAARCGTDGVKLQLLHLLRETALGDEYIRKPFPLLSKNDYLSVLRNCVRTLPPDVVIHRLTGDGNKKYLIAPQYSADKKRMLNDIRTTLAGVKQGELWTAEDESFRRAQKGKQGDQ